MSDQTLDYFLRQRQIKKKDAAEVIWSHAVNSRGRLTEVLTGTVPRSIRLDLDKMSQVVMRLRRTCSEHSKETKQTRRFVLL